MPVVWSDRCLLHEPLEEIWVGVPESSLTVSPAAFREAGRLLGELSVPTVVVQEGGYDLGTLGELVRRALLGLEEGRA
jgi:acetoin utilization deacetylase AcuC-like enzyme